MGIELLFQKDIIVPLAIFTMPVAIVWIQKHYTALEKGHLRPELGDGAKQRITQLEEQNRELLGRVQNLESIVVSLDEPKPQKRLAPAEAIAKMTSGE